MRLRAGIDRFCQHHTVHAGICMHTHSVHSSLGNHSTNAALHLQAITQLPDYHKVAFAAARAECCSADAFSERLLARTTHAVPPWAAALLAGLLRWNPKTRLSAAEALSHVPLEG